MNLSVNHEDALALLAHDAIDIVVYPELSMDEWLVLLSHHRVAPVQCIFWGHPVTTGNPAIDYFISSKYFISDFFDDDDDRRDTGTTTASDEPFRYVGTGYSEQLVLFRGLSMFFTQMCSSSRSASDLDSVHLHMSSPNASVCIVCTQPSLATLNARLTCSMLHLPENRRLYVCPQVRSQVPDFLSRHRFL